MARGRAPEPIWWRSKQPVWPGFQKGGILGEYRPLLDSSKTGIYKVHWVSTSVCWILPRPELQRILGEYRHLLHSSKTGSYKGYLVSPIFRWILARPEVTKILGEYQRLLDSSKTGSYKGHWVSTSLLLDSGESSAIGFKENIAYTNTPLR